MESWSLVRSGGGLGEWGLPRGVRLAGSSSSTGLSRDRGHTLPFANH